MKLVYGFCILAGSFLGTLWLIDRQATACPVGKVTVLKKPFVSRAQFAYQGTVMNLVDVSDLIETPKRSTVVLCEGDRSLGPPHSQHLEVSEKGQGRFSHWGSGFIFSASDNSDPNKNGRTYLAVQPQ